MVALNPWVPPPFDYVAVIPEGGPDPAVSFPGRFRGEGPTLVRGKEIPPVLGREVTMRIVDLDPDPSEPPPTPRTKHRPQPGLRSRIELTAKNGERAKASVTVHRRMRQCLRPGDQVLVTCSGGTRAAVSILRERRLVVAVGDILHSDILGPQVSIGIPRALLQAAAEVFATRDPRFRLEIHPVPLEVRCEGEVGITQGLGARVGGYSLFAREWPSVNYSPPGGVSPGRLAIARDGTWSEGGHKVFEELLRGLGDVVF